MTDMSKAIAFQASAQKRDLLPAGIAAPPRATPPLAKTPVAALSADLARAAIADAKGEAS